MHVHAQFADLPAIAGQEQEVAQAMSCKGPFYLRESDVAFDRARSGFAIALHMHQPLVPAGGSDLRSAAVISHLQYMLEHMHTGDNHNAPVFAWCYKRVGDFIPQLVAEGKKPRIMLDYSGCLLYGLQMMGAHDVLGPLQRITWEPAYRKCVEWLGTAWGHAVAPSTPAQDFRLHVQAWQHQFASIFGTEALCRVRGFSPPEMALPNHPDIAYEFVRTLRECGFRWVMVQEHTVEQGDGRGIDRPHLPHRLVVRNSQGEELSITAIIKTQGSDTKLVAQLQPAYEARGLSRRTLLDVSIPQLVTQIGDGENGGVMMNEFPSKFLSVMAESSDSDSPPMNVTEYLEHLDSLGLDERQFPPIQPVLQARLWERVQPGAGPEATEKAIRELQQEDNRFHMDGGSWTNNISWVRGYENVLGPMEAVSAQFSQRVLQRGVSTHERRYVNALYHLLISQTSCYRYWGQGLWTDYGKELCRRAAEILKYDFEPAAEAVASGSP